MFSSQKRRWGGGASGASERAMEVLYGGTANSMCARACMRYIIITVSYSVFFRGHRSRVYYVVLILFVTVSARVVVIYALSL